ncbi:MAG: DUF11 domain-containing protein [Ruminococcaceae bacterium]|nr:DUF11 domain-containing protein [Oscillospiraceae bacterium]
MKKIRPSQRITSLFLCVVMLLSYIPFSAKAASRIAPAVESISLVTTDPGTADAWEHMMGTASDGNRYAGRVWVDKSVYKDGDVVKFNGKNDAASSYTVSLEDDEAFQIVFSALGSTMTTKESTTTTGPMDVVLVLDTSTSMDDEDGNGVTRLERTIEAANGLLEDLLTLKNVRIAIVTYNADSETVIPLASYSNGIELVVTDYYNNGSSDAGVVTAYDNNRNVLGRDSGYTMGTNLQSGIDRGFNLLANASNVEGRVPIAIVLTDGQANRASQEGFYELSSHSDKDGTSASGRNLYLSTLLNAAYNKTKIEEHYGTDANVYTVGVDISTNVVARLLMNPADANNGFNSRNSNSDVKRAYESFLTWSNGQDVTYNRWTFDHNYPKQNGAITDAKIAANINYADTYYDVSNADISDTFDQIYEELSSGVFNPISSTTSVSGGTGVEHTPLIYVDFIGQFMEIKDIQAVSLFGASYSVIKNADGTYSVDTATGVNPTTDEAWNTSEDILISVIEQNDGTQKLEIRINQEILPIILEQVSAQTVGDETTATIIETQQTPLRIFYTVGVDSDILLPNGQVDISAVSGYQYLDSNSGTVTFYSNVFGTMNAPDNNGNVQNGDAHVGFKPSQKNRYYYHQSNQGIFTQITNKSGGIVTIPENEEYGLVWDESKYNLKWMSYDDYQSAKDDDVVYTYVTYYHPTPSASDDATAAEEITYLIYANWEYLKESAAFFDNNTGKYVNYDATSGYTVSDQGVAIPVDKVSQVISAYKQSNPGADLYAVLGIGSLRTSRLHNMVVPKSENRTDTAVNSYSPEYTHDTATVHNGNDVVVWLGNNGRLTMELDTGIALTKNLAHPIGNADDLYSLTVTVPAGVIAVPVAFDANGDALPANRTSYSGNVFTVKVKAGETVYISGIPAGTECTIGEIIPSDAEYYVSDRTATVTVPTVAQVLAGSAQYVNASVTNAPNEYGNLFITKEIVSNHTVPEGVLDSSFDITVNVGSALAGKTFEAELDENGSVSKVNKTVASNGDLNFTIKARHTVEIFKIPAGTVVTVTESNPGSHFAVSYRTRNHSGETDDNDNSVVIPANANATAVVYNRYTPSPVSVDLDVVGTKNFVAEGNHNGGTFNFKVQKFDGTSWEDLNGKTASVTYALNEHGQKTFQIADVLNGVSYDEVGSFAYRVLEVKGSVENVTYDRTLYAFNVTVIDNDGQLVATVTDNESAAITDGSYEVVFENTYHTAPVSIDIKKLVDNKSGDNTVSYAGFEFKAVAADSNWAPLTGTDASSFSIFSDASGNARFTSVCTKVGTYRFLLSEVEESGKASAGWTYSKAVYRVTVVVSLENGDLVATLSVEKTNSTNPDEVAEISSANENSGSVSFENTYDPTDVSVDLDGVVVKELTGKTLEANEFTFYVYKNNDRNTPVSVGTNDLNGNVNFVNFVDELVFSEVGKYEFDVVERIPDGAVYDTFSGKYVLNGMGYDPTIFDLVIEVTNDASTGKLVADCYFEDSVSNYVTFHNVYSVAPTDYTIAGSKILHGRAPRAEEFYFELYEESTLLETVSNDGSGAFTFKRIEYTKAGVYTYTVKEKSGSVPGVTYNGVNNPVTVVVTVTDNNGILKATANVANSAIRFENTYSAAPATVSFGGTKTLKGATLSNDAFTFNLYRTGSSFEIAPGTAPVESVKNNGASYSFTPRSLSTPGTYYFVIAEDVSNPAENIVYDRTLHHYIVTVRDIGSGQLTAIVTNAEEGTSSAASASVSAKADFVNATFDEVTEKEVFLSGNTTTSIDGKRVNEGDVLTYYITYTNYNGYDVVVDILDTIPEFTSYVDGSASHNGSYAGTHLVWVLNVKRGESVTVSFSVKVNKTEAILPNVATVRDGVNTYHTNEVVNHTVDNVVEKDVFHETEPEISIDGKKVYEGDELLYTITYTNVSGDTVDLEFTDQLPANTTYVENSADNGGVYNGGRLTWNISDVPAWESVTVSFKVKVNTKIGATTITNEAKVFDGTNTFTSNQVVNHTVTDDVKKDVFLADEPTVSIDGKPVKVGDKLVYTIYYKNTDNEIATVTITDQLPATLSYMEGSASHGGTHQDGKLEWTIDVAAGASVTVSFEATVKAVNGYNIENQATFVEGKNTYTSNVVSNPTEIVSKDVPATGDSSELTFWLAALFVSGISLFTITLVERKRKTAK